MWRYGCGTSPYVWGTARRSCKRNLQDHGQSRTCGEQQAEPPRMSGTSSVRPYVWGTRMASAGTRGARADRPRRVGEQLTIGATQPFDNGSSPRVWGGVQGRCRGRNETRQQSESPRVWGTALIHWLPLRRARGGGHPRVCGEQTWFHRKTHPIDLIRPVAEKTLLTSQRAELAYITRTSIKPQPHALLAPNPAFCLSKATNEC